MKPTLKAFMSLRWKILTHLLLTSISIISSVQIAHASHIVGGQLTYRYLGNRYYEIKLIIRRDCLNGADTVPFDNPAIIGVFYRDNQKAFRVGNDGTFRLKQTNDDTLHQRIDNICIGPHEEVCVHQSVYTDTFQIPYDARGYYLVYQRCCRNITITNIESPDETGTTFVCEIKPLENDEINSTPQWGDFPPIYSCANQEFVFDFNATDSDNDSLVYSFCTPLLGKTKQYPADRPDNPPYSPLAWKLNYGLNNLFGPGSPYSLDSQTGLFKVTPAHPAQYLVGICIKEYRKGELISEIRRDFELNVVLCGITPKASFTRSSDLCDGLEVHFKNESINNNSSKWFFDFDGDTSLQSAQTNPSFRYSKEGLYKVLLVAQNGSCVDTQQQLITVILPGLKPRFTYELNCSDSFRLKLFNQSTSNYTIRKLEWCIFGVKDTIRNLENNPVIQLPRDGFYEIILKLEDVNGCRADTLVPINFNSINIDLITHDTTLCLGDSVKLLKNPSTKYQYKWSPLTGLIFTDPLNPWVKPNQSTVYTITATDGICTVEKTVSVDVKPIIKLQLLGDTSTCDSLVKLISITNPPSTVRWSQNSQFNPVISTDSILQTKIFQDSKFYLTAGNENFCVDTFGIEVHLRSIQLDYLKSIPICIGDTIDFSIKLLNLADSTHIQWNANTILLGPLNSPNVKIYIPTSGKFTLYFKATNKFGCMLTDSVQFSGYEHITPDIELNNRCGSLTISYKTQATGRLNWDFGDGRGKSNQANGTYTYLKPGSYRIHLSSDTICIRDTFLDIVVVELEDILADSLNTCLGDSVFLNPNGNADYLYRWSPSDHMDDPTSYNPKIKVVGSRWYYVTITDPKFGDSCQLMDSLYVSAYDHMVPDLEAKTECGSLEVLFKTTAVGRILWDFGDGSGRSSEKETKYTYPKPGKYHVTLRSDSICTRDTFIDIIVVELKLNLADTIISCFGNSVSLNPGGDPKLYYQWSPETDLDNSRSPNPTAKVSSSRWYFVTVTDQDFPEPCKLVDSVYVFVPPPITSFAGEDTVLCETSKLVRLGKSNSSLTNFTWCDANNQLISDTSILMIEILKAGFYILKTTDQYNCTALDTFSVSLYMLNGKINGPDVVCIGDTIMLIPELNPDSNYHFQWKPTHAILGPSNERMVKIYTTSTEQIQLMVSNDYGCTWNFTHTVQVNNPQNDLIAEATPQVIVAGQKVQLNATFNPNWKYLWSPDDGSLNDVTLHNPVAMPMKTTTYIVRIVDESGCTAFDTVKVIVQTCSEAVLIPNAFSPNGDRVNDQLCILTRPGSLDRVEWMIFSRWGEKVFESKDIHTCWDGTFKSKILPPDVFGYIIKFSCPGGEELIKKGNVSILK